MILPTSARMSSLASSLVFSSFRASNGARRYRVKRDFDQIDRSEFREWAFATIRDYFERAIAEIDQVPDIRGRYRSLSQTSFTCTILNKALDHCTAHITVHSRGEVGLGDIYYSFEEDASPNTANGAFHIEADEYELYLSGMMGIGTDRETYSPEAAAEHVD